MRGDFMDKYREDFDSSEQAISGYLSKVLGEDIEGDIVTFYTSVVLGVYDEFISQDIETKDEQHTFGFKELQDALDLIFKTTGEESQEKILKNKIEAGVLAKFRDISLVDLPVDDRRAKLSELYELDSAWIDKLQCAKNVEGAELEDYKHILEHGRLKVIVENTVDTIIEVYGKTFKSSFEVDRFFGVLPVKPPKEKIALLRVGPKDHIGMWETHSYRLLNKLVVNYFNGVSFTRQWDVEAILKENKPVYHPLKLIEYVYGRKSTYKLDKNVYTPSELGSDWGEYSEGYIRDNLTYFIAKALHIALLKAKYIVSEGGTFVVMDDLDDKANSIIESTSMKMQSSMVSCALIQEQEGDPENWAGITIKLVSPTMSLPDSDDFLGSVVAKIKAGKGSTSGSVCYEPAVVVKEQNYEIYTYRHVFDPKIYNIRPLFAFKALDALQSQGKNINPDNILLGRSDKGELVTSGSDSEIDIGGNTFHHIIAGSRAGKGVMTMSLLATYIGAGRPIFYADRKPDMAGLFASMAGKDAQGLPNMCVVNGGAYLLDYDTDGALNYDKPELSKFWRGNLPDYISASTYADIGDFVYYRYIIFIWGLLLLRSWAFANDKGIYEQLGGEGGIVAVIDEVTNWQNGFSKPKLAGRGDQALFKKSNLITNKVLIGIRDAQRTIADFEGVVELKSADKKKLDEAKVFLEENARPDKAYFTDMLDNLNTSINKFAAAKNAGFVQNEDLKSNVFVIGQDLEVIDLPNGAITWAVNDDGTIQASSDLPGTDPISQFMYDFSSDYFLGYNKPKPNYMDANKPGSKASTRLTEDARNFAYFKGERATVMGGHQSTIDGKAKFFKPYLILNNGVEPPFEEYKQVKNNKEKLNALCTQPHCKYVGGIINNTGKLWEAVRSENLEEGTDQLRKEIGLLGYLQQMSGATGLNIQGVLGKSREIGDFVVKQMGYPGSCIEFLMDLRPQWNFSAQSVVDAFSKEPEVRELYESGYNPVKSGAKGRMQIFMELFQNEPTVLMRYGMDVPEGVDKDMFDDGTAVYDGQGLELDDFERLDTVVTPPTAKAGTIAASLVNSSEGSGLNTESKTSNVKVSESNNTVGAVVERENTLFTLDTVCLGRDLTNDEAIVLNNLANKGFTIKPPVELDDMNPLQREFLDLKYASEDKLEFGADSYKEFREKITNDVITSFGGLEHIETIGVKSGYLYVNGTLYNKSLDLSFIKGLPMDKRKPLELGQFASVFDWHILRDLPNITVLEFDKVNFVYTRVRSDCWSGAKKFTTEKMFKTLSSLEFVTIEGAVFERYTVDGECDVFKAQARRSEQLDKIDNWGGKATKGCWNTTKEMYTSKGIFTKILGTGALGAAAAVGASTVGFKAFRAIGKAIGKALK